MTRAFDCEHGFHGPLVAREPTDLGTTVNVDYVCTACGSLEYTVCYTPATWLEELTKQQQKEAARRAQTRTP